MVQPRGQLIGCPALGKQGSATWKEKRPALRAARLAASSVIGKVRTAGALQGAAPRARPASGNAEMGQVQ